MKTIVSFLFLRAFVCFPSISIYTATVILLMQMSACQKCCRPVFNAQETVRAKMIAGNWKIQSLFVDDIDKTSTYAGMTIQFTATSYTPTNGRALWPAGGTWSFISDDGLIFKRDDGILVNVEVTDTILKLTLTWPTTTLSGGKLQSIKGVNVFTFAK
jgi:hypothetical protein